jgi:hypothetical protein
MAAGQTANQHVRDFWMREYESYPARFRAEVIAPLQNKVGAFLANPMLARIVTQPKSGFDLRQIMDEGKILLVNLAKGRVGEDTTSLFGAGRVAGLLPGPPPSAGWTEPGGGIAPAADHAPRDK